MTRNQNSLVESGTVIAFGTAILYCVNAAYYGGYLSTLQLDSNLLDQNLHQILYNGFFQSLIPAFCGMLLYIFVILISSFIKIFNINRWLIKQRQSCIDKKKDNEIDYYFKKHLSNISFYFVIFVVSLLLLIYFESEGEKAASLILEKIKSNAIQENELITVNIDGKPEKLFHLMCGARNCAGIDPKSKVVYYFPQNGHSYHLRELKDK